VKEWVHDFAKSYVVDEGFFRIEPIGHEDTKYLQQFVKKFAEDKGWRVTIEQPVLKGLGSVDVALEKDSVSIACEISVASTVEQELGNIQKCLAAGFSHMAVVSAEKKAVARLKEFVSRRLEAENVGLVHVLVPEEFFSFLEELDAHAASKDTTVRGYKVKVRYKSMGEAEKNERKQAIAQTILGALKRLKDKE
jgi:hypothetical protein